MLPGRRGVQGKNNFNLGGFSGRVVAMERDFLGISGKDSGWLVKDESRGSPQDSGLIFVSKLWGKLFLLVVSIES